MEMTPKLKHAVKECKAGNAESFECLYKESEKYIYTCIYKIMSGNSNALDITEEVMQETYLEIFLNISQLENEDRFLSWAGTIANRKCFAYIKKNKKYVLLDEEDGTFENLSDSDDIIPEEVMQSKEKQRLVREIIDTQLTEVQKICIYEFFYNQKKQSEIAELYGMPVNTVKTNLSRAKMKIEEGIVYLEKKKDTKLYSFAPFFVLLFTEDVMAAEVPARISESVLSGVTDAAAKAAEAGVDASVAGAGEASTAGAATSAASRAGLLGKIVAASTKAKIIMVVATISVAGAIGGSVMVASQDGLFGSTSIISESKTAEDNQQAEENQTIEDGQIVEGNQVGEDNQTVQDTQTVTDNQTLQELQDMEEKYDANEDKAVLEVVELSGECVTGTETRYTDGTSDYEIYYVDSDINKTIHYRMTGLVSGMTPKNWAGYCRMSHTSKDENDNYVESISMYIAIMTDETYSFASQPEENFYDKAGNATYDSSTFRRVETEKDYRTYLAGNREEFGDSDWKSYNLWIDDNKTGRAFKIMLRGSRDLEYEELLYILDSIEIVEITD